MTSAILQRGRSTAIPASIALAVLAGLLVGVLGARFSPAIAVTAATGALLGLLLLRYPELALYLTVALIPIERFGRFTDDNTQFTISLMRIVGMAALGVLLVHRLIRRQSFTFGPAFYLYAGYVGMGLLSIVYTTDTLGTVRGASTIVGNLLFFFVVVNLATSRKRIFISLIIWLAVSVLIGVYTTYDWHFGSGRSAATIVLSEMDPGRGVQTTENRWATVWVDRAELEAHGGENLRRTMGPTSHAAVYGINCILTIPFLLYFLRLPIARVWKGVLLVSLGIITYNVFLTNTRAAILLAALVAGLCVIRGLVRLRPGHLIIVLVLGVLSVGVIPEDVFERILDISNYTVEKSASLRIRQEYFEAGVRAVSENWLYGSGLANENIVPEYLNSWSSAPDRTTVHNEYLQTCMEVGLVGLGFLIAFIGLLYYYCLQSARHFARQSTMDQEYWLMVAIQTAMLGVVIYGLQLDVFHFPLKGWWLLAGITVVMHRFSAEPGEEDKGPSMEPGQERGNA